MDSEGRLRELRQAALGCVVRLDGEGRIVEFNAAAEKLFGCAGQDAMGQRFVDVAVKSRLRNEEQLVAALHDLQSFAHSISHDFRAPLRHLDGFVSLLLAELGEGLTGDARHFLDVIAQSSQQMNGLIENLLSFSRAGTAPLNPAPLDMRALVEEVVREALPAVGGREIAWTIGALPEAVGDPALLRQAWACLVDNALKFTRRRPRAEIEIGTSSSDGETTYFVRDNGAGFEMAYVGKLFSPFQRLHHVRDYEGVGIGLAIVRRIIARHGGRTWAEGAVDAGAKLYFSLPS